MRNNQPVTMAETIVPDDEFIYSRTNLKGVIEEAKGAVARNAALVGCCQAIEHYEIARYGTLREWAKAIDQPEAHEMLSGILDQEKAANFKLTNIAVTAINKA